MARIGDFKAERLSSSGAESRQSMLAVQFLIAGVGAAVLFSASWYFARAVFDDPFRIWRRQLLWMLFGVLAGIVVYRLPKSLIKRCVPYLVWISLGLNLLTYLPGLGYSAGGARRWIEVFGFTFQPSELTRIALVLYLARMLEKNEGRLDNIRDGLIPPMLVVLVLVSSVYFQNDFSTAAYLFILAMGMFFAGGVSWRGIGLSFGLAVLAAIMMLFGKPYRLERIQSWLNPGSDPSGTGYQLLRARLALERGGFWGMGLGRGEVKRGGLPAAHSDFVVAVMGEETGFIGIALLIVLFSIFALKGWKMAERSGDAFSLWAIFGLVSAVYWQVLLNLAVVSGTVPATGIPLPLFSAGGSAAFITIIIFALIMNFAGSEEPGR